MYCKCSLRDGRSLQPEPDEVIVMVVSQMKMMCAVNLKKKQVWCNIIINNNNDNNNTNIFVANINV